MNLIKAQLHNAILLAALSATVLIGCATNSANAQSSTPIPSSLVTPDRVNSRIGTLEYKDGVPTVETAERVRDTLYFTRALNAYNNSFRGASAYAMGKGFQSIGAEDNSILIFSTLMDSRSLFLTGNTDTVYYMGIINPYDGSKTYKVTLPKGIPARAFWSLILYDNQSRSMLQTPQRFPRAGSQSYPSPAAEAASDGSTTVFIGPKQPQGVKRGNWIQTDPAKGWFTILRLYSPLEPFFTKEWRPSEIELVR